MKLTKINTSNLAVKSERLRLSSSTMKDARESFAEFTEEVAKYMYPKPYGFDGWQKWFREAIVKNKNGQQWQFTIFDKITNEFIGMGGVHHIDGPTPELGIWTKESSWGHGYGREAVTAAVKWAQQNLSFDYLKYPVEKLNIKSRKIAEMNGGILEDEYLGEDARGEKMCLVEYRIYPKDKNMKRVIK
ncbi:GNAT family N-acetyltransferase [Candidatus Saccharibacteria bacterium]|nr:GNAT family N-acetyltransferase [Candidatus Saccharibacteria bacterium]